MEFHLDSETRKEMIIIILVFLVLILIAAVIGLGITLFHIGDADGKIGINVTSGECQVDILNTDGESLVGDVLSFVSEEDTVYFHPGYALYTEGFRIKNEGTIAVNFRVSVSEDEDIDGDRFREAFDLYITKDITDLENTEKLTSFSGKLEVGGESEVYYLVVSMKEDAGNDFQDKTYTGIGITVHAIQANAKVEE